MLDIEIIEASLKDIGAKNTRVKSLVNAYGISYFILSVLWLYYDLNGLLKVFQVIPPIEFLFAIIWSSFPLMMFSFAMYIKSSISSAYESPIIKLHSILSLYNFMLWFYICAGILANDLSMPLRKCIYLLLFQHISLFIIRSSTDNDHYTQQTHWKDKMIKDYIRFYRNSDDVISDEEYNKFYNIISRKIDKYL